MERRGVKVRYSNTDCMCECVRLQGAGIKKVEDFKDLAVQSNGECGKEVKKRVQASWNE